MRILILLLLITHIYCSQILTSGLMMSGGFDFVQGGTIPLVEERVKYPIFTQSFSKLKTYKPAGRPDLEFIIPDNIALYPLSNHKINKTSDLYHETRSYISYEAHGYYIGVSINLGEIGIGGTYSEKYNHMRSQFNDKFQYAAVGSYTSSTFKIVNPPFLIPGVIDDTFSQLIKTLPREYNNEEDLRYVKILIDYYGQFFIIEGIFGGEIKYSTFISQEIAETKDIEWTERQLELSFRYKVFNISGGEVDEKGHINIDSTFKMYTNDQLYYTGGFRNLQTNNTLKEWDRSIDDSSQLIGGKFALISDLIMDDPIKRKNLEWVLSNYCNTGGKLETPRKIFKYKPNHRYIPGFNLIGSGFDPKTKQIKASLINNYEFTGQMWTNPIYNNISFEVPNTITVTNEPESYEMNYTSISYSKSEFERNIEKYTSSSYAWGLGHESDYYHEYTKYFEEHNKIIVTQMKRITWYKLSVSPNLILNINNYINPGIKMLIDSLGTDYSDPNTRYLYDETIKILGPEIITGVRMGGGVWLHLVIDKDIFEYMYIKDVIHNSGMTFFGIFQDGENWEQHLDKRDKIFISKSSMVISYDGGYWNEKSSDIPPKPWPQYKLTIKDNPSPLEYESVPLDMIITDKNKKKIMRMAIDNYYKNNKLSKN